MKEALRSQCDPRGEGDIDWHVTQCKCGEVILEFGPTSVRMTREDLARLYRLTQAAMQRFHIDESAEAVGHESDVLLH